MPIYEYQCGSCESRCEVLRKISDEPLTLCPNCGEEALVKQVSAAGFRLKGQGWYETDFKSGKKKNLAESSTKKTPCKDKPSSSKSINKQKSPGSA
ncbi:MAG: transcriptional regulator [Cycloclasticus sp. symbiont of Poecilosclerida sp. M]|nr:MAG: transcriptional regulator [Cycloclasticus sp. symbiont of Poecilosclerida sp. M]